ncbi:hypothetical protein MMYC01_208896 [Madurella mycetomatis]|uniref:Uncharacterized protein n=1 Tax=Madurella mycetomatis TaxID=100816 RepID=A0A175VUC3_9PEZI|nr:hypothetical protein MMYC01_208896 [Madurella mycetomatis]
MGRSDSRPPSLPCIPDVDPLDLDEKSPLLPIDLEDALSSAGCEDSTIHDEDCPSVRRTGSTSTRLQRRIPARRFPSNSSTSSNSHTYNVLIPSPSRSINLSLSSQPKPLQLAPSAKTIFESWTITYHLPTQRTSSWFQVLGVTWCRRTDHEEGYVVSVVPNPHFSQAELAATVACHQQAATVATRRDSKTIAPTTAVTSNDNAAMVYAVELERRLRGLDWKVQDEIYELLSDRVQSSSSPFRRREWRVVVLAAVPGGEMTDTPTGAPGAGSSRGRRFESPGHSSGFGFGGIRRRVGMAWRNAKERRMRRRVAASQKKATGMPITEYRLILRGTETKANDQGWGYYNRYSKPWKAAEEKELEEGVRRRWSSMSRASEKYVDF